MTDMLEISADPQLSLDFIETVARRHMRPGETFLREEDRVRVLDDRIANCIFQFSVDGPASTPGDILALEPRYIRLGDEWLSSARYYSDIRFVDRLRAVIADLCREAVDRSWWFWIYWDLHTDVEAFASAKTMLRIFEEIPDFDWKTNDRRLSFEIQSQLYASPSDFHGRLGAVIEEYCARETYTSGSISFGDVLPELEPVSGLPSDPTNCSICLVRPDASGCAALEAFVEVAARFRQNDSLCRFFANFISQYGCTFDIQDAFGYQGLQRQQPFVILRLPGEPEWQGEGAEALARLQELISRASAPTV
jgi:hypothetical protein